MNKQLYLHAGFHKTGTSAIQQFAARNRRRLKAGGVLYPRLWPATFRPQEAHHFLAHAVAGNERFVTISQTRSLVSRWQRWAGQSGGQVLLSSEAVCRHQLGQADDRIDRQRAYLERLANVLEGFEVEPVLVVRRQDEFVRSLYQEHVAAGLSDSARRTFPDFVEELGTRKIRFLERLELFRSVFGRVRVLVYEELASGDLARSFFEALGVSGLGGGRFRPVRTSLTVGETLVKQRINRWIASRNQNRLVLLWLRSRPVQRIIARELEACHTLWPDVDARRAFVERFDKENERIAAEFLNRGGFLFPPLAAGSAPEVPSPAESAVDTVVAEAVCATRWRIQVILGRQAISELVKV